jgi:hypothetical protein
VWIFIIESEPLEYFVAASSEVADLRRDGRRLSVERARQKLRLVPEKDLAEEVHMVARGRRNGS